MDVDYLPDFAPEGEIADIPLPVLIAHILDEKLNGMLHLEHDETKSWIFFEDGFPAGVHAPQSQDFLGTVLRELGLIDDMAFNDSLMNMAKTKRLQGELLLESGTIEEDQLERALSLQLARKLSRLFSLRSGTYRFAEYEELPPPMEPIRVNPYALIYNGIKNTYTADDLKKGLEVLVGRSCKVSGIFIQRKELFEFPSDDMADAELLREFRLPQEFVRGTRSGPTAGMMMLMALLYCGMLELEEAQFAVSLKGGRTPRAPRAASRPTAQQPAQAAAPKATGTPNVGTTPAQRKKAQGISDELRKKINDKFEQVKTGDLWEILEVEQDADMSVIKKSFITMAKVYHPDRLSGTEDEELSHRMDMIFARLNEAHVTLSDPERRAEYDKKGPMQKDGKAHPEEAKVQFQKAIVYIKKRDLMKAAESMRWAADLDPKNGDYRAYNAWLEYERDAETPQMQRKTRFKDRLIDISKGFPASFHALKFLAAICHDLNDDQNYVKALKLAYKLNPNDVEIARQLRLVKIRKEKEDKKGWLRKKLKR
jgi:curved DNA-binding protein CbpA